MKTLKITDMEKNEKSEHFDPKDEIVQNNEMIARYLGWYSFRNELDTFWHKTETCSPENWDYHSVQLDFHNNWKSLIEVIEMIATKKFVHYSSWCDGSLFTHRFEYSINEETTLISEQGINSSNIGAAYLAVSKFIKSDNEYFHAKKI